MCVCVCVCVCVIAPSGSWGDGVVVMKTAGLGEEWVLCCGLLVGCHRLFVLVVGKAPRNVLGVGD